MTEDFASPDEAIGWKNGYDAGYEAGRSQPPLAGYWEVDGDIRPDQAERIRDYLREHDYSQGGDLIVNGVRLRWRRVAVLPEDPILTYLRAHQGTATLYPDALSFLDALIADRDHPTSVAPGDHD